MTRNGDEVYLSYKQLAMVMVACVAPAVTFSGFLYEFSDRLTIVETRQVMYEDRIENNRLAIDKLNNHSATLERIEQHLVEIDRRLSNLEHDDEQKKP